MLLRARRASDDSWAKKRRLATSICNLEELTLFPASRPPLLGDPSVGDPSVSVVYATFAPKYPTVGASIHELLPRRPLLGN